MVALGAELFMCVRCCLSSSGEQDVGANSIFAIGHFLVCFKCGTFASERVRLLSKTCSAKAESKQQSQLKNWSKGVHPVTGVYFGLS